MANQVTIDTKLINTEVFADVRYETVQDLFENRGKGGYFQTDVQGDKGWRVNVVDGLTATRYSELNENELSEIGTLVSEWHSLVERLYAQEGYIDEDYKSGGLAREINPDDIVAFVSDNEGNVWGGIRVIIGNFENLYTPKVIDFEAVIERISGEKQCGTLIAEVDSDLKLLNNLTITEDSISSVAIDETKFPEDKLTQTTYINAGRQERGRLLSSVWAKVFTSNIDFDNLLGKIIEYYQSRGKNNPQKRAEKSVENLLKGIWDGDGAWKSIPYKELLTGDSDPSETGMQSVADFISDENAIGIDFSRFVVNHDLTGYMGQERDTSQLKLLNEIRKGLEHSVGKPSIVMSYIKPYNSGLVYQAATVAGAFFNGSGYKTLTFPVGVFNQNNGEIGHGINKKYVEGGNPMIGYLKSPTLLVLSVPR